MLSKIPEWIGRLKNTPYDKRSPMLSKSQFVCTTKTLKGSVTHSSLAELSTKDQIAQKARFWISCAWLPCWDIRTCNRNRAHVPLQHPQEALRTTKQPGTAQGSQAGNSPAHGLDAANSNWPGSQLSRAASTSPRSILESLKCSARSWPKSILLTMTPKSSPWEGQRSVDMAA